ncbi:MAG: TRAP transporter large permease [Rhodospirillaceae bacterium]
MDPLQLALVGTAAMFVLIAVHVPIGAAMTVVGVAGVAAILDWSAASSLFATVPSSILSNSELATIPLFLLMGSFAGSAGLSSDLYRLAYALVGQYRGGLAMATIGGCAGFGAICGSSIATATTFTRVALPEMIDRRYDPGLAAGCCAAGGTLGILIPPSIILVLYAVLTEQFVLTLFAAAVVPGIIAVVLYLISINLYVRLRPGIAPPGPRLAWSERGRIVLQCWRVLVLAFIVSGGIYAGIFTVEEAAAVGASLAFFFALVRGLSFADVVDVLKETASNTGLIYLIMVGASVFTYFMTLTRMPDAIVAAIEAGGFPPLVVILLLLVMYLILGSVFDTVAAMIITLPVVFPVILSLGYDPIWWGVMNVMVIEIGMITPPIGMNVFIIHGLIPDISLRKIFGGIVPFLCADIVRLALLLAVPGIALWFPELIGVLH